MDLATQSGAMSDFMIFKSDECDCGRILLR